MLGVNHWSVVDDGKAYVWAILVGPSAVLIGIAGVVDPRIALATGKYGTHLPLAFRLAAAAIIALGLGLSALLALRVYHL
jgi:hypothetical protein